jgi:hypothetical protein
MVILRFVRGDMLEAPKYRLVEDGVDRDVA